MARGCWPKKLIDLRALSAILKEAPKEVELDLYTFYNIDYQTLWRPGGLTLRKLALFIEDLESNPASRTWGKINKTIPLSMECIILTDIFSMLSEQEHPLRMSGEELEAMRAKEEERADRKRAILERQRARRIETAERERLAKNKNLGKPNLGKKTNSKGKKRKPKSNNDKGDISANKALN